MDEDLTATSKFLSYVLRHNPGAIGLTLDEAGWTGIDDLLRAAASSGREVGRDSLERIVRAPGKQRLEISGDRIRAAQGHSVAVDLGLSPAEPPLVLYHGTVGRFLPGIFAEGLKPGKRNHVHLSADAETATQVGSRRGEPVILAVDAAGLHGQGQHFYRAANGVWLTSHVDPGWLSRLPGLSSRHGAR